MLVREVADAVARPTPPGGASGPANLLAGVLRVAGAAVCTATGFGIAVERYTATDPQLSSMGSRLLQAHAAAAVIALVPAVLAVMSWFERSVLLLVAAGPLWLFAAFGVYFPVLRPLGVASVLFMIAFATGYDGVPSGWIRAIGALVLVPSLVAVASGVLFFLDDLWTHPAVTLRESSVALFLAHAALLAAWVLTIPSRRLRARRGG